MSRDNSSNEHEVVAGGRNTQDKRAFLAVGLTIAISLVAIIFVRPRVGPWLEVRWAYRDLSNPKSSTRTDAINRLRNDAQGTKNELLALLHHSDKGVRHFAASELAHRTSVADDIIDAFLTALESNRHVAEIGHSAPGLFVRYAEDATGPLTRTDRRMIAWLKTELNSTVPRQSGSAAWAMTAFAVRDPSIRGPLAGYLKNGTYFYKYAVLRRLVDDDPSMRDQYVELLLSGLKSPDQNDQANAMSGLRQLKDKPDDLNSRLAAIRKESTDPAVVARIEQVLEELRKNETEQP